MMFIIAIDESMKKQRAVAGVVLVVTMPGPSDPDALGGVVVCIIWPHWSHGKRQQV